MSAAIRSKVGPYAWPNIGDRLLHLDDLFALDIDVGNLSADAAVRLMDHHRRMRQREPCPWRAREQHRRPAYRQTDTNVATGHSRNCIVS